MHNEVFKSRVLYYDSLIHIDYAAERMPEIHGPPGQGTGDRLTAVRIRPMFSKNCLVPVRGSLVYAGNSFFNYNCITRGSLRWLKKSSMEVLSRGGICMKL